MSATGRTTEVTQVIHAPRDVVYWAFLDADAVAEWLSPDGMRAEVERLEPHVGGKIRMTLTYIDPNDMPDGGGKTTADADVSEGKFVELVPGERIVQVFEFEAEDARFAGEMRMVWLLRDVDGGTEVTCRTEDIPVGIRLEDNEEGTRMSLRKLAKYVEDGANG